MTLLIRVTFLVVNHVIKVSLPHTPFSTASNFGNSFRGMKNGICFMSPVNTIELIIQKLFKPQVVILQLWFGYFCNCKKLLDFFCLWSLKCVNNTSPRCTQYRLGYYHQPRSWLRHFSPGETRCLFLKPSPVPQSQSSQTLHLLSQLETTTSHQLSHFIRIVRNIWFSHNNVEVCFWNLTWCID